MAPNDVNDETDRGFRFWASYIYRTVPVLFFLGIIIWSYYAYVFEYCIGTITLMAKLISFLAMYHIILLMFLWCFLRASFTKPKTVPNSFRLPEDKCNQLTLADNEIVQDDILEDFSRNLNLPYNNYTLSGGVRYCNICRCIKPDRAHHCTTCGRCMLKMDHHCPMINNCITFNNYKYFVLFLGYGFLYLAYVTLTSGGYFLAHWKESLAGDARLHIVLLCFISFLFSISLASLLCYHCQLIRYNRTTIEAIRPPIFETGPDENGYDLGLATNFREVFGGNRWLWFFPVFTSLGNGITYQVQPQYQDFEEIELSSFHYSN